MPVLTTQPHFDVRQSFRLAGNIVSLEPLQERDVPTLRAQALGIPELWRWTVTKVRNDQEADEYFAKTNTMVKEGKAVVLTTRIAATSEIIGTTRFYNFRHADRAVEIGYTWVIPAWQRSPVNTEAKYLMLRHAFEHWSCVRVDFEAAAENQKSRGALKRLGAHEEGVLRSFNIDREGQPRDKAMFSIIAPEWPALKAHLEQKLSRPWQTQ